jgi:glutaconate CoA-transferase subunit A
MVVPIAGGAHPSSCDPLYGFDMGHFKEYAASASGDGIDAYLEKYVSAKDEQTYQSLVGGIDAIRALPLPVY